MENETSNWEPLRPVFDRFVAAHPELGLNPGYWAMTNVLRTYRTALVAADVIRMANKRHWIADNSRFNQTLFDLITGGAK